MKEGAGRRKRVTDERLFMEILGKYYDAQTKGEAVPGEGKAETAEESAEAEPAEKADTDSKPVYAFGLVRGYIAETAEGKELAGSALSNQVIKTIRQLKSAYPDEFRESVEVTGRGRSRRKHVVNEELFMKILGKYYEAQTRGGAETPKEATSEPAGELPASQPEEKSLEEKAGTAEKAPAREAEAAPAGETKTQYSLSAYLAKLVAEKEPRLAGNKKLLTDRTKTIRGRIEDRFPEQLLQCVQEIKRPDRKDGMKDRRFAVTDAILLKQYFNEEWYPQCTRIVGAGQTPAEKTKSGVSFYGFIAMLLAEREPSLKENRKALRNRTNRFRNYIGDSFPDEFGRCVKICRMPKPRGNGRENVVITVTDASLLKQCFDRCYAEYNSRKSTAGRAEAASGESAGKKSVGEPSSGRTETQYSLSAYLAKLVAEKEPGLQESVLRVRTAMLRRYIEKTSPGELEQCVERVDMQNPASDGGFLAVKDTSLFEKNFERWYAEYAQGGSHTRKPKSERKPKPKTAMPASAAPAPARRYHLAPRTAQTASPLPLFRAGEHTTVRNLFPEAHTPTPEYRDRTAPIRDNNSIDGKEDILYNEAEHGKCQSLYDACREEIERREGLDDTGLSRRTTDMLTAIKRMFTVQYIHLVEKGCGLPRPRKVGERLVDINPEKIKVIDPERFAGDFERWYGQLGVAGRREEQGVTIFSLAKKLVGAVVPARKLVESYQAQFADARLPDHIYFRGGGGLCTTDPARAEEELDALRTREKIAMGGVLVNVSK